MSDTGDYIECFNKQECIYTACPQFNTQIDTCNFRIIGLLKDGGVAPEKSSEPTVLQQKRMSGGTKPVAKTSKGDTTLIRDLKPNDKSSKEHKINIEGTVVYDPKINTTGTGKEVCNLVLKDESGQISLAFWDDEVSKVMDFTVGDKVRVENIWKIDEPYEGNAKASPGKWAKVIAL